jgi:hypothetical protein
MAEGYHKHSLPGMSHRGWQNGPARLFAIGAIHTPNLIKIQHNFIFLELFFNQPQNYFNVSSLFPGPANPKIPARPATSNEFPAPEFDGTRRYP